jgi:hypothetical protein
MESGKPRKEPQILFIRTTETQWRITMGKKASSAVKAGEAAPSKPVSRSLAIADGNLRTGADFAGLISALISDVVRGSLAPPVLSATCNGVGKLLKMVELQHKYGGGKPLQLS